MNWLYESKSLTHRKLLCTDFEKPSISQQFELIGFESTLCFQNSFMNYNERIFRKINLIGMTHPSDRFTPIAQPAADYGALGIARNLNGWPHRN